MKTGRRNTVNEMKKDEGKEGKMESKEEEWGGHVGDFSEVLWASNRNEGL